MISWIDSIQQDLETADYMENTADFNAFLEQSARIVQKTLQHFIYCKTGSFPGENNIVGLLDQAVGIEKKFIGYTIGIQEINKLMKSSFPENTRSYPDGTSRTHYLDFCRELLEFILKLLR